VLNGPSTNAWLGPWFSHIHTIGGANFEYYFNQELHKGAIRFNTVTGLIDHVAVYDSVAATTQNITADYYVFALPMGPLQVALAPPSELVTDPEVQKVRLMDVEAHTDWCAGIQFLLKNDVSMVPGHVYYPDSAWALSSISQAQFWGGPNFLTTWGNNHAAGLLSVDVSNWEARGRFAALGKLGVECTTQTEVVDEIWAQLNDALFDGSSSPLEPPGERYGWHLDDNILFGGAPGFTDPGKRGVEPLLNLTAHFVHPPGSYAQRPQVKTTINNMIIASDYAQTTTDLATMEGANEAGRRACNAILQISNCPASPCTLWPLVEPAAFDVYKQLDQQLFALGDPHAFEILGVENVAGLVPPVGDLLGVLASLIP
jgi:hypothetical protein